VLLLPEAMGTTLKIFSSPSLGLQWWQHMIVKALDEHCIATEVADSTKTVLITKIQLCTTNITIFSLNSTEDEYCISYENQ
jgi:hypothetical protein